MAAAGDLTRHEAAGIRPLAPELGLEVLAQLRADDPSPMVVVAADWNRLSRHPEAEPLLAELRTADEPGDAELEAHHEFLYNLLLLPDAAGQRELLLARLREETAAVMRLAPERLHLDQALINLGMDSIMAVELSRRVTGKLGLELTLMDLLKGSNLNQLVDHLIDQVSASDHLDEMVAILADVEQEAV